MKWTRSCQLRELSVSLVSPVSFREKKIIIIAFEVRYGFGPVLYMHDWKRANEGDLGYWGRLSLS